jgi:hypothetical protein
MNDPLLQSPPLPPIPPHRLGRCPRVLATLWLTLVAASSGCEVFGFAAHVIAGGDNGKKVTVQAEYRGLEGQSVAVLVSADEYIYFEHPKVVQTIGREVSARLASTLPGVRVTNPLQLAQFQRENPYWNTLPYGDLIKRLGVDRLVYLDLIRYTLHEPGNTNISRGVVSANLGVAQSDASEPNRFVYSTTLQSLYPESGVIGLLNADVKTIELATIRQFSQRLANLFRDHEVIRP